MKQIAPNRFSELDIEYMRAGLPLTPDFHRFTTRLPGVNRLQQIFRRPFSGRVGR
ncbi:MAG: hypothetical protein GKR97_02340 [Rhizobiaceae bacterium]|nr:hypothetical protein [Rhizobiaceae bacterium]